MRIAIIAPGSRGDVQPYIALGKGLAGAGHEVRLVTHENFRALVESYGLEFWLMGGNVTDVVQGQAMRDRLDKGNFLGILAEVAKEGQRAALAMAEGGLAASQGVDLLLGGMGGIYNGIALAEKLGLPFLQAHLLPFTPTGEFASVLVASAPAWLGGGFNRLTHHLLRQMMWQGFRGGDARARRETFNLPPAPFSGPYNSDCLQGQPILYGFSPSVLPPPADWGDDVHVTGYWFLDSAEDWQPPAALTAFLEAGPPPVYVGFGSMSSRKPEETANLVLAALARTGQRAILLSGWSGMQTAEVPDSVFVIESVPHAWLFPRVAAVVHHGGAGTTAAGLRAGVPSLVIPFFGDQPFWGKRVADLGVGPSPIPRKKLTVEKLAEAIERAATDETMRQRAANLGAKIRAEDGIARAVAVIGEYEGRGST